MMDSVNKQKLAYRLCIMGILIIAAFIYFYRLDKESLITDEFFSLHVAQQPLKAIILDHQKDSNPNTLPPLYEIIMHLWLKVFGLSEFAQRSFSALLGVMSVYILYRLVRLLFDTQTGLISASFGSLSFLWFTFFRQNRCYSLFMCLTLLSFYVFFYYLKDKKSKLSLPVLIVINIALTYTHYFAFLVIFLELLFGILEWRKNKEWAQNIILMGVWVAFAYADWYTNLFYDIGKEPLVNIKIRHHSALLQILSAITAIFSDFHVRWNPLLIILYLPLMVMGFTKLARDKSEYFKRRFLYIVLICAVPILFVYAFTLSDRIRYYSPFSFPFFILIALGLKKINTLKLRKFILLPLLVFIISFNVMDFYDFFRYPLNENWKEAVRHIKEIPDYQDKEMVFVFQTRYNPPVFAYYYWGNETACSFIDNIANYEAYQKDLAGINTKHKVYLLSYGLELEEFFDKLGVFPEDAWIWVFGYHDIFSSENFRKQNDGRYFLHQIALNPETPQIDLYLLKKLK